MPTAALALNKVTNLALSSPKQTRENPIAQITKEITRHSVVVPALLFAGKPGSVPPVAKKHATERTLIASDSNDRTFRERSSAALRRRLFPHTNMTTKQLAYALRISEPTIWNLLSGNNDPSGRVFFKLTEFFGAAFLQEVFGGPNVHCIDPRDAKKAAHIKQIAQLQAELEAMG